MARDDYQFGPNYVDGSYGFNPAGPFVSNKQLSAADDSTAKAKNKADAKARILKTGKVKNNEDDFAAADEIASERSKTVSNLRAARPRRK